MDLHVTSSSSFSPPHPNPSPSSDPGSAIRVEFCDPTRALACPSCGHRFPIHHHRGGIQDLPGLPAGVKFDPTDQEIVEHLEAKIRVDPAQLHPLLDEFIPTLEGQNGICYTHPEKLPGVSKDGQIRHFFHRPSKAYTTGTRKRRKVHTDDDVGGGETRWHKTGKTRPVIINGSVKGFKKILVLYTNYSRQKKPEKTNWIMHQYHLGNNEEEKDGEIALSKVFYQTQPRQCGSVKELPHFNNRQQHHQQQQDRMHDPTARNASISRLDFYPNLNSSLIQYNIEEQQSTRTNEQLIPNLSLQGGGLPFVSLGSSSESRQTKE